MTRSAIRPPRAAFVAIVLASAGLVVGCGPSPAPATAVPSAAGPTDVVPTPVVTAVPTAEGPQGDVVLTAENIAFTEPQVTAPAGVAFTLQLVNKDAGIPHGVEILDGAGRSVYRSEIVAGPAAPLFNVPALEASTYTFLCPVHPNMTGTLVAGG